MPRRDLFEDADADLSFDELDLAPDASLLLPEPVVAPGLDDVLFAVTAADDAGDLEAADDDAGDLEAADTDAGDLLELQAELQTDAMAMQIQSEMMAMQHQTALSIIDNMGDGSVTHEWVVDDS